MPLTRVQPKTITLTTTGNADNVDFGNADVVYLNNASLLTIRGLLAGAFDGQEAIFISIGAGQVDFAHQNANSSAANRLLNVATSASTSLAPGSGSAFYRYDLANTRWRLISHEQGAWITPTFNAGNWAGFGAMTWTVVSGDVAAYRYRLSGRTLDVSIAAHKTTTVGGTANNSLLVTVPGGFTIVTGVEFNNALTYNDNNGGWLTAGMAYAANGSLPTQISLWKTGFGTVNWSLSTSNTGVYFEMNIEVA